MFLPPGGFLSGALPPAPDGPPVQDGLPPDVPRLPGVPVFLRRKNVLPAVCLSGQDDLNVPDGLPPDVPLRTVFPAPVSLSGQDGLLTVFPLPSDVLPLPGASPVPGGVPAVPDVLPVPDEPPAVPDVQGAVLDGFPGCGCCFWNSEDG